MLAVTNGSNVMHSQVVGNLFPSDKLKGYCTFAAQAVTIRNDEAEGGLSVKQEGEGETGTLEDKGVGVSDGVGEMDQSVEYITCFAKVVEPYQKKNKNCFSSGSPNHFVWDCPKDVSRLAHKACLNMKEGMAKKEAEPLTSQLSLNRHSWMRLPKPKDIMEDSLLEPTFTYSLEWSCKHSTSQDKWWEQWGFLGQWFYDQCSDPRVCGGLLLGHWPIEWPGQWYFESEWFWWTILQTIGLHYHTGSGGRSGGLWWRSGCPGCSRFNWLWLPGAGYFGHTNHQSNHKCD